MYEFYIKDMKFVIGKNENNMVPSLGLLGGHHSDELFVVDLTVAINISFSDHLVNLFVRQFFSQICHHVT